LELALGKETNRIPLPAELDRETAIAI